MNKTTVTVTLKEALEELPTAEDFTVTIGEETLPVTNVTGTNTDGVYDLTVDLDGKEGIIAVNGVEATEAIDFVGPTIVETVAQSATVFDVKFSEKVDKKEAENVKNYELRYAVGKATTIKFASTASATVGSEAIEGSAVLLEDGQTVRVTITKVADGTKGFKNGGLESGSNYQVKVSDKVVDEVGNGASTAFGPTFQGTDVADSTPAKALSAAYNASTGVLTLTFDKAVEKVDSSKVKLTAAGKDAVELTSVTGIPTGNTVKFDAKTLAKDIAKLGEAFDVTYTEGAFKDVNGNDVKAAKTAVAVAAGLQVTSAGYNEESNVLTLAFNDTIDIAKLADTPKVKIAGQGLPTGTKLINKENSNTLQFQLPADYDADGKVISANVTAVKTVEEAARTQAKTDKGVIVTIEKANSFYAVGSDEKLSSPSEVITIEGIDYVFDETAPTVESVTIEGLTATAGTVTVTLSEAVNADGIKSENFTFYAGEEKVADLSNITVDPASDYTKTLTFDLSKTDPSKAIAKKLDTAVKADKELTLSVAEKAFKDVNTVENEAVKDVAVTLLGENATEATVVGIAKATGSKVVTLKADKENTDGDALVSLDKASAETASNYTIVPTAGGAPIAVDKASYDAETKTITLYLKDVATKDKNYEITASNLKNQAGDVIAAEKLEGKFTATFKGVAAKATTDLVAPIVAKDVDQDGKFSAGDTLTLDFGTPIKLNDAKASDFTVAAGDKGTPAAGTLGSAKLAVDGTKLVITLASDSKVAVDNIIKLDKDKTKLTNVDGEKVSIAGTAQTSGAVNAAVVAPETKAPEIAKAVYYDANENGKLDKDDTIKVTFTSAVSLASEDADITKAFEFVTAGADYTATLAEDGLSATLKLTAVDELVPGTTTINVADSDVNLVGLWDKVLTKSEEAITIEKSDTVQPEIQSATYEVTKEGTKQIVLQMSEKVNVVKGAKFDANFTVTDGTIKEDSAIAVDEKDATKVIITLADAKDFISKDVTKIKLKPSNALAIQDANGNKVKYTGTDIVIK